MDREDGRFSTQVNGFKKHHPYHNHANSGLRGKIKLFKKHHPSHDHTYSRFCVYRERHIFSGNQQSVNTSAAEQYPNKSFTQFPSPDDIAECSLMKALRVSEPILKELVLCINEDKIDSDTMEEYALKQRKESNWLVKHFTDVQINIIHQNTDCDKFDLTLKCGWIDIFKEFNQTLINNEELKHSIDNTVKKLKKIRNNLCHERNHFTKLQCHDIANDLKVILGELLEIIHTWHKDMNIITEKKEIEAEIDKIMEGGINKGDFKYMCLKKVIKSVVVPALNNVTQLICYDKKKDNIKEYLLNKGMKPSVYKDKFFKAEKEILESNSDKIRGDVTLYTKLIEICKEWYDLEYYSKAKEELTNIIRKIRDIRNCVSHSILSMSPEECVKEAKMLGDSLKYLVQIVQKKRNTMEVDAPLIDIDQIYSDINGIMSVSYPYQ